MGCTHTCTHINIYTHSIQQAGMYTQPVYDSFVSYLEFPLDRKREAVLVQERQPIVHSPCKHFQPQAWEEQQDKCASANNRTVCIKSRLLLYYQTPPVCSTASEWRSHWTACRPRLQRWLQGGFAITALGCNHASPEAQRSTGSLNILNKENRWLLWVRANVANKIESPVFEISYKPVFVHSLYACL